MSDLLELVKNSLTIKEVAFALEVSEKTVYRWCKCRKINSFKIVGSVRIPKKAVEAIIEERNNLEDYDF